MRVPILSGGEQRFHKQAYRFLSVVAVPDDELEGFEGVWQLAADALKRGLAPTVPVAGPAARLLDVVLAASLGSASIKCRWKARTR